MCGVAIALYSMLVCTYTQGFAHELYSICIHVLSCICALLHQTADSSQHIQYHGLFAYG